MIKAHAVPVPFDSVLAPLYVGADLLDAFAVYLPAGGRELVVVTVVHCHNRLGRAYLALIAPFHRVIAQANLEQVARAMES